MKKLNEHVVEVEYGGYRDVVIGGGPISIYPVPEPGYFYVDFNDPSSTGMLFKDLNEDLREYATKIAAQLLRLYTRSLESAKKRYKEMCLPYPKERGYEEHCEHMEKHLIPWLKEEVEKWKTLLEGLETGKAKLILRERSI